MNDGFGDEIVFDELQANTDFIAAYHPGVNFAIQGFATGTNLEIQNYGTLPHGQISLPDTYQYTVATDVFGAAVTTLNAGMGDFYIDFDRVTFCLSTFHYATFFWHMVERRPRTTRGTRLILKFAVEGLLIRPRQKVA